MEGKYQLYVSLLIVVFLSTFPPHFLFFCPAMHSHAHDVQGDGHRLQVETPRRGVPYVTYLPTCVLNVMRCLSGLCAVFPRPNVAEQAEDGARDSKGCQETSRGNAAGEML